MPARRFEDSSGAVWEVFEVQRSSQKAQAVSAGLEEGWLSFVCGETKRRLAPFPAHWHTADVAELERLCAAARAVVLRVRAEQGTTPHGNPPGRESNQVPAQTRTRVPRIRSSRRSAPAVSASELPIVSTATSDQPVETVVREFARQARSHGASAIDAMVQLKALLGRLYTDPASGAADVRAVRRWFVETYYFADGTASSPDGSQSL